MMGNKNVKILRSALVLPAVPEFAFLNIVWLNVVRSPMCSVYDLDTIPCMVISKRAKNSRPITAYRQLLAHLFFKAALRTDRHQNVQSF